jgi:ADP-heptose:LPS heptosyltransferase
MALDLREFSSRLRRILVVKLSSMGDIIMATPCLRALRLAFPGAQLHLAIESRWADVVRQNPNVDALIECSSETQLSPRYLLDVHRRLSAAGPFDLALDFQGTRRSAAWVYLSRAKIQAGRGRHRPGWKATAPIDRTLHAVRASADFCQSIGVPVASLAPEIHLNPHDNLTFDGIPPGDFVLLNPFTHWPTKDWPAPRAADLAARISRKLGMRVVLTGSSHEAARAQSVVQMDSSGSAVSLAGCLTLAQALCLFRRARLMVSCDSGPMHAAAALGTPVVALFGPTHPEHTGPWGEGHRVVQALRPTDHHAYRSSDAMQYMAALDVDTVFQAVREML